MIASLEGVVGGVAADSLVLEVGGIGYRVYAAPAILAAAEPGKRLKLHTHHLVREDLQALYGFRSADELGFFGLLMTVTGVGPKVALGIVGSRPVTELQLAILADDQAVLTAIGGVGKRLAARIALELKEKWPQRARPRRRSPAARRAAAAARRRARSWPPCRPSATRSPKPATPPGPARPPPPPAGPSRTGSRPPCGRSRAARARHDRVTRGPADGSNIRAKRVSAC